MAETKKILRVATIIAGILLFALSIIRLIKITSLNFTQNVLSIYMM